MARSFRFHGLQRDAKCARIKFGGEELAPEVTTRAELREWIREKLRDADDVILALFLRCALERDNSMANLETTLRGKTITFDPAGDWSLPTGILRVE